MGKNFVGLKSTLPEKVITPTHTQPYIRLAELEYEWNQLKSASDHLGRGMERARLGGDVRTQIAGTLLKARLSLTKGERQQADEAVMQAERLVEQAHFPDWTALFERSRADVWIAENNSQLADEWRRAALNRHASKNSAPESDVVRLAVARVSIAKGNLDAMEQALALLDSGLQSAEGSGRRKMIIESLTIDGFQPAR